MNSLASSVGGTSPRKTNRDRSYSSCEQHPLLERLPAGEPLVAAVADAVLAGDQEDHVLAAVAELLGRLHEDVEPAHRLHPAGRVGDDLHPVGDRDTRSPLAAGRGIGFQTAVSTPSKMVRSLSWYSAGNRLRCQLGRAVPGVAVVQVEQDHGVAGPGPQAVERQRREVRAEVHVRVARPVEVLEVVDDRDVRVQLAQEQRRAEPGVADDQVRLEVRPGLEGLVDAVGVPDGVLERAGAVVVVLGRPAVDAGTGCTRSRRPCRPRRSVTNVQRNRCRWTRCPAMWPNWAGKFWWTKRTCIGSSFKFEVSSFKLAAVELETSNWKPETHASRSYAVFSHPWTLGVEVFQLRHLDLVRDPVLLLRSPRCPSAGR